MSDNRRKLLLTPAEGLLAGAIAGVVMSIFMIALGHVVRQAMAQHTEALQMLIGHAIFGLALGSVCLWLAERAKRVTSSR